MAGHPHVHVLYWDKSGAIHPEAMSESRFEIFSEKVRAEFNREIFQEELHEAQEEKNTVDQELRLTLRSMLTQANVAETMDIKNVSTQKLDQLSRTFFDLVSQLPAKGAWKYAYLSEETKEQLNAFFDTLRSELPDFERQYQKYLMLTRQVSALYGNGEHAQAHYREQAQETMYRNLGNEFLKIAREYRNELQEQVRPDSGQLHRPLYQGVRLILPENKKYRDLLSQMPKFRTPMRVLWRDTKWKHTRDELVQELSNDIRVRIQMRGFLNSMGERLSKEDKAALWKTEYRTLYQTIDHLVSDALREDAGYDRQARVDAMADALLRLFHTSSQGAGQLQSRRDLLRLRKKELSKTAQRDRAAKLDHSGDWTPEWQTLFQSFPHLAQNQ